MSTIRTTWVLPKSDGCGTRFHAVSEVETPGVPRRIFVSKFSAADPGLAQRGVGKLIKTTPRAEIKDDSQNLESYLASRFPATDFGIVPASMKAGEYHPLIWRPNMPTIPRDRLTRDASAAANLYSKLERILLTIEPIRGSQDSPGHEGVFGHDIRELLILACTEVEAALKNVLEENKHRRSGMGDYVKLCDPMRLTEYRVDLVPHWGWPAFAPFEGWSTEAGRASPSAGLGWYSAYNDTKHDRDKHFDKATLGHAISALGAVYVLMIARYGPEQYGDVRSRINPTIFGPSELPSFTTFDQQYVPRLPNIEPVAVPVAL